MTLVDVLGLVSAIGVMVAGLWTMWGRRSENKESARVVLPGYGALGEPTRLLLGVVLLVAGYHGIAYSLPDAAIPLKVPRERWWLLAIGVVVALGGAIVADRMEGDVDSHDASQ